MKTVASFRDALQGHLAKDRLEAEGISAILLDDIESRNTFCINWTKCCAF